MALGDIGIRPAQADDADAALPLIYSAGPEAFEYVYRQGPCHAADWLRFAFVDGGGFFGFRNHHVAEIDGLVVASASFYSRGDYKRLTRETLPQTLRFYRFASLPVLRRSLAMPDWMKPPGRNMLYLADLGVSPDVRGQGVGQALLEFGRELAARRGKSEFGLDVAETNPRAEALYRRFGLNVQQQSIFGGPPRPGHSVPAARRMVMTV